MFLANDPWVGAAHQQDVMLICPVFWKGELFCWVTNCLHQYDLGGITPSSFCGSAEDAFEEGICIPPVKIVEGNEIRRDIEELYLRSSRKPEAVALDFRAQLAGNITARDRVAGADPALRTGSGQGRDEAASSTTRERAFLTKLKRLPDGVWRERPYVECCRPGDRGTYRVMLTLRKKGIAARLRERRHGAAGRRDERHLLRLARLDHGGAEPAPVLGPVLLHRRALRHVEFDPTPGTFNCANFPASVSTAPIQAMEISLYPAYNVPRR